MFFTMRYKPDNTTFSATHEGVLGKVILRRKATSTDEEIVWMWRNVQAKNNIFRVQVDIQANSSLNPALYGKSAGILVI